MAGLVVLVIMVGSAAFFYLKSTVVKTFGYVVAAIFSFVAAFGYYELLAAVFLSRSEDSNFAVIVPWAQPLSFVLIFILVFAILQTIVNQLTLKKFELDKMVEQIGRGLFGLIFGLILAGVLVTALVMGPLPNQYPYQRFDPSASDTQAPSKVFPNADGFVTGLFGLVSAGSLGGQTSFAAVHPSLLNEAYLNRLSTSTSLLTPNKGIDSPKKEGAWTAPEGLKYTDSEQAVEPKSGYSLVIVRAGIPKNSIRDVAEFTPSQLRVICKDRSDLANPSAGSTKAFYPFGYLKSETQVKAVKPGDLIKIPRADFSSDAKWIDWAVYIPSDYVPVAVGYKQNNIAAITPKLNPWPQGQAIEPLTKETSAPVKPAAKVPAEPNKAAAAPVEPNKAAIRDANSAKDANSKDANSTK
jgi:hypothetical protein